MRIANWATFYDKKSVTVLVMLVFYWEWISECNRTTKTPFVNLAKKGPFKKNAQRIRSLLLFKNGSNREIFISFVITVNLL